jgi:magnesium transporter
MKFFAFDSENSDLKSEQVSIILGNNFVISFQECDPDIFEPIKVRLQGGKGRSRKQGSDYLAYALIDLVIDSYFVVLEKIGEHADLMEDELISNPDRETAHIIHTWKRNIIFLRKNIWPLRELISNLEKEESTLIKKTTRLFVRDLYDHAIHIIDTIETYRDIFSGMLDIYLSSVSNRMNEVMKVLTIIATIFIPISFFAGVYGMNFKYMPELEWNWSYPVFWVFTFLIVVIMLFYFRRKKWL